MALRYAKRITSHPLARGVSGARVQGPREGRLHPARRAHEGQGGNPVWFVPVMLTLMVVGLVWVVTFYITTSNYPIEAIGRWNLAAGFGLMMAGFAMTTRWR